MRDENGPQSLRIEFERFLVRKMRWLYIGFRIFKKYKIYNNKKIINYNQETMIKYGMHE